MHDPAGIHGHGHEHKSHRNNHITEQDHPLWTKDRLELRSIGVDIGSSTSHLVVSRLELRRQGAALSSRFELKKSEVLFYSPVILTPFLGRQKIDTDALEEYFHHCLAAAGLTAEEIDTGAVITTGDAARRDNASAVADLFAKSLGTFVCATAGPMLEARMAAYGSGAVSRSLHMDGKGPTILSIDIGGGTTKFAISHDGQVVRMAAMNVGARLIVQDDEGVVTSLEPAAELVAKTLGIDVAVGRWLEDSSKAAVTSALADSLIQVAAQEPLSELTTKLMIDSPLTFDDTIDEVVISGGVSEYVYDGEVPDFGDLGRGLAGVVRSLVSQRLPSTQLIEPHERIRATVIGASQFTLQVSGSTIHLGVALAHLPLRDLTVVPVDLSTVPLQVESIHSQIEDALTVISDSGTNSIALAFNWPHSPAYSGLHALSSAIKKIVDKSIPSGPIVVVINADIARLVGSILEDMPGCGDRIICIDGVQLQNFDYIDIGKPHPEAGVVTVTIKSLVFSV